MKKYLIFIFVLILISISFAKTVHISSDYVEPTSNLITYEGSVLVFIESDNLELKTNQMQIEKQNNKWIILNATGVVEISFNDGKLIGENLNYNIETQYGNINEASLTILDSKSSETILVICESLTFDLNNDYFEGKSVSKKITIIKGNITAYSYEFTYDKNKGIIVLNKDVELIDNNKNIKLIAEKITLDTESNNMKAEKVQVEIVVE